MAKSRINSVLFGIVWSLVPNFVSTIAFVVYIYTGNSLTVPTAFTVRLEGCFLLITHGLCRLSHCFRCSSIRSTSFLTLFAFFESELFA